MGRSQLGCRPAEYSVLTFLAWLAGWHDSVLLSFAALTNKIAGGTRTLLEALVSEADPEIRLGSPVAAVDDREDEVVVTLESGDEIRAGVAVVTVRSTSSTPLLSRAASITARWRRPAPGTSATR